jgi:hypothetical protein
MTETPGRAVAPDLGGPYEEMLKELRDEHGTEIDLHIQDHIRDVIHESYKELDA